MINTAALPYCVLADIIAKKEVWLWTLLEQMESLLIKLILN